MLVIFLIVFLDNLCCAKENKYFSISKTLGTKFLRANVLNEGSARHCCTVFLV